MGSNKKNILIVSCVFAPEPITSAQLNFDLAEKLGEKHHVVVFSPKPSRPIGAVYKEGPIISDKFEHIQCDSYIYPESRLIGRCRESVSFGRKSVQYIKEHHAEIDFVYNDGWQLFGFYEIAKVCVKYHIPYIVPIQDIYPEALFVKLPNVKLIQKCVHLLLDPIDNYYMRHATRVRTISNGMADYMARTRKIDRDKFLVVANWQNDSSFVFYSDQYKVDNVTKFMFAGSINERANVDLIIKAFAKANIPNAELYIMGGGAAKDMCLNLVKENNFKNIFFDEIPNGQVAEIQSKADVMVLALQAGAGTLGLPSKLTAYMLSGKPVIASIESESDTAKIIRDNQCGVVTLPDDENDLSEAFKKMAMLNLEDLKRMGEHSRKYSEEHLSKQVNLDLVCNTIEQILN